MSWRVSMLSDMHQYFRKKLVDQALSTLFPVRLIPQYSWSLLWMERENKAFLLSARVYFGAFCAIYLAHFFFVDLPADKKPLWIWASYRGGCAALHFIGFLLTFSIKFMDSQFKRIPVYVVTAMCVYMQGKSMEWLSTVPPFYIPLLGAIGVLALRASVSTSALAFIIILAPSFRFYVFRPYETHHMVSATLVSLAVLTIFRSRKRQDVELFVAEQVRFQLQAQLIEAQQSEVELSKKQYYLAAQIAHDIRSPLATLNAIVHNADGVDDQVRDQIKNVVARIRDIANKLLKSEASKNISTTAEHRFDKIERGEGDHETSRGLIEVEMVSQLLSSIISEKRHQYSSHKEVEIYFNEAGEGSAYFAKIQRVEFGRVLSNLVDNAFEATGKGGKIAIELNGDDHQIQISVEDNGTGMSSEILSKIGTRGFSYGKNGEQSGSGLGIYHAMESIKLWGGSLTYKSEVGKGTSAIINLPRSKMPVWIAGQIKISCPANVVVLDDDDEIHAIWKKRFAKLDVEGVTVLSFKSVEALIGWYRETLGAIDGPLYLCDFELPGSQHTGLDMIEMLGIAQYSILVTNRWDDPKIRAKCDKLNVKILPKVITPEICVS